MHLQEVTHHASHLLLGMQLAETQTTRSEHFSTTATRKTAASTPNMLCPHTSSAMNHQLWLRQGHYQRPTEKLQVRKTRIQNSAKTGNQQPRIRDSPLKPPYDTYAAHIAVRALASAPPSAAAPWPLFEARPARHGTRATPASRCSPPPPGRSRQLGQRTRRRLQSV